MYSPGENKNSSFLSRKDSNFIEGLDDDADFFKNNNKEEEGDKEVIAKRYDNFLDYGDEEEVKIIKLADPIIDEKEEEEKETVFVIESNMIRIDHALILIMLSGLLSFILGFLIGRRRKERG